MFNLARSKLGTLLVTLSLMLAATVSGAADAPYPGTVTVNTSYKFNLLVGRLEQAIGNNQMGLVASASASRGAASRDISIAGNEVLMVFRNDYAVRMLAASVPAGIEAPLRLYVTENSDGTASITYRKPSAVFAPYGSEELNTMAAELDPIFARIVAEAAK